MKGQEIVRACLLFIRNFFIYSWQTPESVSVYVCWRPFANLGGSSVCVSVHDWRWWCATVLHESMMLSIVFSLLLTIIWTLSLYTFSHRYLMHFSSIFAHVLNVIFLMSVLIFFTKLVVWSVQVFVQVQVEAANAVASPPTHPHFLAYCEPHLKKCTCQLLIESGTEWQSINCSIVWVNRAADTVTGKCQLREVKMEHKQTNWNCPANWMQLAWILNSVYHY